jgi:hypothetical protein
MLLVKFQYQKIDCQFFDIGRNIEFNIIIILNGMLFCTIVK